MFGHIVCIN